MHLVIEIGPRRGPFGSPSAHCCCSTPVSVSMLSIRKREPRSPIRSHSTQNYATAGSSDRCPWRRCPWRCGFGLRSEPGGGAAAPRFAGSRPLCGHQGGQSQTVTVGQAQLSTGMRTLFTRDEPHPCRSTRQVDAPASSATQAPSRVPIPTTSGVDIHKCCALPTRSSSSTIESLNARYRRAWKARGHRTDEVTARK
ncbi:hypothetical protein BKP42_58620 [Rhodococcus erythropolis]|nr:hypothetical protein BKP42_58620 [Rhodococcus erythropolis]